MKYIIRQTLFYKTNKHNFVKHSVLCELFKMVHDCKTMMNDSKLI